MSQPPQRVRTGTIKLAVSPDRVTVGTYVEFTFDIRDADTGNYLLGQIMLNGQPFTYASNPARLSIDGSPLHFTISIPGYQPAAVDVTVEQPAHALPPPPPPHGSDLVLLNVWVLNDGTVSAFQNEYVGSGEGFTVTALVRNAGPDPAGAFNVSFIISGTAGEEPEESVQSLAKGAIISVAHHFSPVSDGSHDAYVEIDSGHVIDDPQRQNNTNRSTPSTFWVG
jgi:hypothetical protein